MAEGKAEGTSRFLGGAEMEVSVYKDAVSIEFMVMGVRTPWVYKSFNL